jgi:hypothetical protein
MYFGHTHCFCKGVRGGGVIYIYVFNCLQQRPWFLCFELLTQRNQLQMHVCSVIIPSKIPDMTRSIHSACLFTIDAASANMKTDTTATMSLRRDAGSWRVWSVTSTIPVPRDFTQRPTCSPVSQSQQVLLFRHHECVKASMPASDRGAKETQSREGNGIFLVPLRPERVWTLTMLDQCLQLSAYNLFDIIFFMSNWYHASTRGLFSSFSTLTVGSSR